LVAHCAVETYSVLTRLPQPHRASPAVVRDFLAAWFPDPFLHLTPSAYRDFLLRLPEASISGGQAYDALVAATAAAHDAELVSRDRRALSTYERFGIRIRLLP
jgi:predicted nucleic acid-binding protein